MRLFRLDVRMEAPFTQEQEADMKIARVNDAEFDEWEYKSKNRKYYYVPLTFDLDDVKMWRPDTLNDEDTVLVFPDDIIVAKIGYEIMDGIMESMRGVVIKTVEDFAMTYNVEK